MTQSEEQEYTPEQGSMFFVQRRPWSVWLRILEKGVQGNE